MRRVLTAVVVLLALVGAGFLFETISFHAAGPAARPTVVLIKPHSGVRAVAATLKQSGVIASETLFLAGVRLRGEAAALKAGEYAIPKAASMADIAAILIEGKSIEHKLTAAEGLTSDMIARLINADTVLTGPPVAVPAEGSLLPQTYLFLRGTTRAQLLARMQKAQIRLLAKLWPKRDPGLPYTTQEQALTVASIVEKETALPAERRHIAALFVNRLRLGMKLQSDPTIIYGITKGYPLGRGIRQSELAAATPYNTYAVVGLPPSPICNPGTDAIEATLNPGKTDDLYFVASGGGGHVFSKTIEEQARHVAELRAREREQQNQLRARERAQPGQQRAGDQQPGLRPATAP